LKIELSTTRTFFIISTFEDGDNIRSEPTVCTIDENMADKAPQENNFLEQVKAKKDLAIDDSDQVALLIKTDSIPRTSPGAGAIYHIKVPQKSIPST
jgi:hypothetical protein